MSDEVLVWLSVWGGGADYLHMVQLLPLPPQNPHHLLPHLNPDWYYLSDTGLLRLFWGPIYKISYENLTIILR